VKSELNEEGLNLVEWGGDIELVPVSAKTGEGIEDLLTTINLTSEISNLRANPDKLATAAVIEANLDRARGPIATVIVQSGTLRPGDVVVAGSAYGKVRALYDDRGKSVKAAEPGTPVRILGHTDARTVASAAADRCQSRRPWSP